MAQSAVKQVLVRIGAEQSRVPCAVLLRFFTSFRIFNRKRMFFPHQPIWFYLVSSLFQGLVRLDGFTESLCWCFIPLLPLPLLVFSICSQKWLLPHNWLFTQAGNTMIQQFLLHVMRTVHEEINVFLPWTADVCLTITQ